MDAETVVIVPTYGEDTVGATIRSVLDQDVDGVRCILVNNGGPDPRPHLLDGDLERIEYVHVEVNRGVCPAVDDVYLTTDEPFVLVLHADDAIGPGFVRCTVDVLRRMPEVGLVEVAGTRATDDEFAAALADCPSPAAVRPTVLTGQRLVDHLAANPGAFVPSMSMMRRAVLRQLDGPVPFDPRLRSGHDFHLFHRLAARTAFALVDEPLGVYRIRPGALSTNRPLMWRDRIDSMQLLLDEDDVVAASSAHRGTARSLRGTAARRLVRLLLEQGDRASARRVATEELRRAPDARTAVHAVLSLLPAAVARPLLRGRTTA